MNSEKSSILFSKSPVDFNLNLSRFKRPNDSTETFRKTCKHGVTVSYSFFLFWARAKTTFCAAFCHSDGTRAESLAGASGLIGRDYRAFNCATLLRYRVNTYRRRCVYTNGLFIALKRPFPASPRVVDLGIAPPRVYTLRNAHSCATKEHASRYLSPFLSSPPGCSALTFRVCAVAS